MSELTITAIEILQAILIAILTGIFTGWILATIVAFSEPRRKDYNDDTNH